MAIAKKTVSQLFKDPFIWLVLVSTGLFWFTLSLFFPFTSQLEWPLQMPVAFIIPVVLYPIVEEIVFRGAIMDFFKIKTPGELFLNLTKANLITSILFTGLHFFYHPPLWASAVFIPSLIFGFLKERYQSLIPPILIHVFFNAGYYWMFTH